MRLFPRFFPAHAFRPTAIAVLLLASALTLQAATYTVNSTADTMVPTTLRYAITQANTNLNADTIIFNFTTPTRIALTGALPVVTAPLTVNGTNTTTLFRGTPYIEINGAGVGAGTYGLRMATNDCQVNGLRFTQFPQNALQYYFTANGMIRNVEAISNGAAGIQVYDSANVQIGGTNGEACLLSANSQYGLHVYGSRSTNNILLGSWIGVRRGGTQSWGNAQSGVIIEDQARFNRIGGTNLLNRNIIAANGGPGILLQDGGTTNNRVLGNYLGVDATGTNPLRNTYGVQIQNGAGYTEIGAPTGGNVIAAHYSAILIDTGSVGNLVRANLLGVDATGARVLTNRDAVIQILGGINNTIGGTSTNTRNVIAGGSYGILISGSNPDNNIIRANFIGLNAAGTQVLSNRLEGIRIESGLNHLIGGTGGQSGNVISGNGAGGINLFEPAADTWIFGNLIGTDAQGLWPLGNGAAGIYTRAPRTLIGNGDWDAGGRNVISGNAGGGIIIASSSATGVVVSGNFIGTDGAGSAVLSNGLNGITVQAGAHSNTIGGINASGSWAGNVICGSQQYGIFIDSVHETKLQGNYVGIDESGWIGPGNGLSAYPALSVINARNTLIGGAYMGFRNLIGGSSGMGIELVRCFNTEVAGNFIGVATNHTLVPNSGIGLNLYQCTNTVIGGALAAARNIIGGNTYGISADRSPGTVIENNGVGVSELSTAVSNRLDGIQLNRMVDAIVRSNTLAASRGNGISLVASTNCLIVANIIGLSSNGQQALPNDFAGVAIDGDSISNRVGAVGLGNLISGNRQSGLWILGRGTRVENNIIGLDAAGLAPLSNATGILIQNTDLCLVASNLVSGNAVDGIRLLNAEFNTLLYNHVGTDASGWRRLGNGEFGVKIINGNSNFLGGADAPGNNRIAFNGWVGLYVDSGVGNSFLGNAACENLSLDIDLGAGSGFPDGPTANDPLDADSGANDFQNYPLLTFATNDGAQITVAGSLQSSPLTPVVVEIHGSRGPHPTGYGGSDGWLGAATGVTDIAGLYAFVVVAPTPPTPPNTLTALAHTPARSCTSEFSPYLLLDSDGDGMGDGYEFFYNGVGGLDPDRDDDEDGVTHLQEFLADTDPTDPDSFPRIQEAFFIPDNRRMSIAYPRTGRRVYRIVTSASLNPPWTTLDTAAYSASGIATAAVPVTLDKQYFRLAIDLP